MAKKPNGALVTHSYYIDSPSLLTMAKDGGLYVVGTHTATGELIQLEFGDAVAELVVKGLIDFGVKHD